MYLFYLYFIDDKNVGLAKRPLLILLSYTGHHFLNNPENYKNYIHFKIILKYPSTKVKNLSVIQCRITGTTYT